jgi:hypothetical protein
MQTLNEEDIMADKIEVTATYHHDSKNFHAFVIDESQAVKGSIYVHMDSASVPQTVTVRLRVKGEVEKKEQQG